MAGGSAFALSLSRPAQALLALRPVGSLSHPRWPLSRGSGPTSYPAKPLVSFRTYRQLSGWNPPPLIIRAFRAHCQFRTSCSQFSSSTVGRQIPCLLVALALFEIRDQRTQLRISGIERDQLPSMSERQGKIPRVPRDRDERH